MPGTTFFETFSSSANTSNQETTVLTAGAGEGFDVDWVGIHIVSAAGTAVDVQVFSGEQPVAPQDDAFDLSGEFVTLPADHTLSPSGTLVARHDNTSASARQVRVVVAGDEH